MLVASAQSVLFVLVDPSEPAWLEFLEAEREATAFHHPAWSAVLAESYGYRPFAVALTDSSGRFAAGLPMIEVRGMLGGRRWISLPFTDYCPALSLDAGSTEALVRGLGALRRDREPVPIEIRAEVPGGGLVRRVRGVRHTLELSPGAEAVLGSFSNSHQRGIARARRDGVTVRRGDSREDLTELFFGLHARTRRRLGVPVQPRDFFEALWERIIEPRLGFVLLASVDHVPIAAAVFLDWNGTVIYKYGASDAERWRHRANHLVLWEAIRSSCERGHRRFDFGRSDLDNEGLRSFKSGWGAKEEPLLYSSIGGGAPSDHSGVARRGMSVVIKRSPVWVTRAVGGALYRYGA